MVILIIKNIRYFIFIGYVGRDPPSRIANITLKYQKLYQYMLYSPLLYHNQSDNMYLNYVKESRKDALLS